MKRKWVIEEAEHDCVGPITVRVTPEDIAVAFPRQQFEKMGEISDGYHTFDELYEHRFALWIALCRIASQVPHLFRDGDVWRAKKHSDGTSYEGWFMLGMGIERTGSMMTYHLPLSRWDDCGFAETYEYAPAFDGHTSADVLERLKRM